MERHIEAEYDAWVTRIESDYSNMQYRTQDLLNRLMEIDSGHEFDVINRKFNLGQVLIYLLHGGDADVVLEHLKGAVK